MKQRSERFIPCKRVSELGSRQPPGHSFIAGGLAVRPNDNGASLLNTCDDVVPLDLVLSGQTVGIWFRGPFATRITDQHIVSKALSAGNKAFSRDHWL